MNESEQLDVVSDQFIEVVGKDPDDYVNDIMSDKEKIDVLSKMMDERGE
ncbi:hypothetical protein ACQKKJ_13925 [Staphylococcus cohnii]|nr:hypothetical protein [Staphylococcus saprophyticus]